MPPQLFDPHPLWPNNCSKNHFEPIFRTIVRLVVQHELMPAGDVVDAGAHRGHESCYYADLMPARTVHALEPVRASLQAIRDKYLTGGFRPNLQPMQAGLGSRLKTLDMRRVQKGVARGRLYTVEQLENTHLHADREDAPVSATSVPIFTIDMLFRTIWPDRRLGFAHLDVEGAELDVLRGGALTFAKDRPIFSVEVHVAENATFTRELLTHTQSLGCDT